MKKLITALMILMALFCFTACEPEDDPTPPTPPANNDGPGNIDTTTLDGIYVQTLTINGKPCNASVIVINGNTQSFYEMSPAEQYLNDPFPTAESLNSMKLVSSSEPIQITRNDANMTFTNDAEEETYQVITDANGTWLSYVNNPDDDVYQKVELGHYGTPMFDWEYFFSDDGMVMLYIYDETIIDAEIATENNWYETLDGTGDGNTYVAEGIYPYGEEPIEAGAFTVTINGNTATVSDTSGFLNEDAEVVPGDYTRYVRTTPWPAAPAAE